MTPAIASVVVAVIAALAGWGGARFGRRKEKADAAKVIVDAALSLINPLKIDLGVLTARISVVETENARLVTSVAKLEVDNRNLRSENSGLRARIGVLEHQLTDLGHTPLNGNPTTIVQTTETKTITTEE